MARLALILALAVAALGGCSTACPRPERDEPLDYTGGTVDDGVYMSSDWYGEWLHFPGGAYYRLHHGLGEKPRTIVPYLSFERTALERGSVAPAAGNQVQIEAVDDETVTVVNGSCAEYWLLIVASSGDE